MATPSYHQQNNDDRCGRDRPVPLSTRDEEIHKYKAILPVISASTIALTVASSLGYPSRAQAVEQSLLEQAQSESTPILSRSDVGFIDLNTTEPEITDVCWLDVQIGDSAVQRIEISLYGKVTPVTASNFKSLCTKSNQLGVGYKDSEIFRVIPTFSIQGGNIGAPSDAPLTKVGRYGTAADGKSFPAENYRILHSYEKAGVVSMMKDIANKGLQDSRFFITTSPYASWADDRYVAFGRVSKGMDFVQGLSITPTIPPSNYPKTQIRIVDAGCY